MACNVTFWGTRGSIPVSGQEFAETGGNTSCVEVELDGVTLFLDAGTGIKPAGERFARKHAGTDRSFLLLLTHPHWDHIQGFPFFRPLWEDRPLRILVPGHPEWAQMMLGQIDGSRFPVDQSMVPGRTEVVSDLTGPFRSPDVEVSWIAANHPGDCLGYRLDMPTASLVYLTDNELGLGLDDHGGRDRPAAQTSFDDFVAFCRGADLLVHDAQYTGEELAGKVGWGHSSPRQAVRLASEADVGMLALFHHDPGRTDAEIRSMVSRLDSGSIPLFASRDGMRLSLP